MTRPSCIYSLIFFIDKSLHEFSFPDVCARTSNRQLSYSVLPTSGNQNSCKPEMTIAVAAVAAVAAVTAVIVTVVVMVKSRQLAQ